MDIRMLRALRGIMDEINENLTKETVNVKKVTETVKKNASEMKST